MNKELIKIDLYLRLKGWAISVLAIILLVENHFNMIEPFALFYDFIGLLIAFAAGLFLWLNQDRIKPLGLGVNFSLLADLLVIVSVYYLSGGPESTWGFMPLVIVIAAGYLLGLYGAVVYSALAYGLILALFSLEYWHLVPHHSAYGIFYAYWYNPNYLGDYLMGLFLLYFLAGVSAGYYNYLIENEDAALHSTASEAVAAKEQLLLSRADLEARVRERTRELEKARADLEQNFNERTKDLEDARRATLHLLKDLKEDMTKLQMVDRMKTEFMSMVSHELRTPLTPIKGYLSLILEDKVGQISDQQREALGIVIKQSNHLQDLIDSLLDLSRLELGKPIPIVREPLSIKQVFDDIIEATKIELDKRQQDLKIEIVGDPPAIMADSVKLKRILANLVGNAMKFTPRGGEIKMRALAKDGGGLRIEVIDNGIGIPPNLLEKVFEKFYQIDSSYTREAGGIGMGLTIARELAELHGGRLWAESAGPGKGSKFVLELPVEGGSEHGA